MSPSSPTSSATWIRTTRFSISPTTITISCAWTTLPWLPQVQMVYRIPKHPAAADKQQLAEFHHRRNFWYLETECKSCVGVVLPPQEIGAELMRESVATTLFSSQSKGKRDRDTLCIRWERKSPKHLWTERWFCRPRRREAQQILYQAEAEARNWERRNSDFAFREINQEFESQRFQLHQASPRADQAQRDKINVYGDLELRNRLFQEDYARDCQEFEELRKICCEEIDQAIQARIEGLSLQQYRNPSIVSQMVAQILDLQNKVNSLSYAR